MQKQYCLMLCVEQLNFDTISVSYWNSVKIRTLEHEKQRSGPWKALPRNIEPVQKSTFKIPQMTQGPENIPHSLCP